MPTAGEVYDLQIPAPIGPWSNKSRMHPGLVVSRQIVGSDRPWIVVPMTGTKPHAERPSHVLLEEKIGTLDPPLWICCEYPTTVPQDMLVQQARRGFLRTSTMTLVRAKLAWALGLGFGT